MGWAIFWMLYESYQALQKPLGVFLIQTIVYKDWWYLRTLYFLFYLSV